MSKFIITENIIDEIGKIDVVVPEGGKKFRLLDDDGIVYFNGVYYGDMSEDAFSPLDDYGSSWGCTDIQYLENNKWESL